MIYPMYSVKDIRANQFSIPRADLNQDCAKRFFAMQVNTPENMISFSPGDFELYCVGIFDEIKGSMEGCTPEFICRGTELVGVK